MALLTINVLKPKLAAFQQACNSVPQVRFHRVSATLAHAYTCQVFYNKPHHLLRLGYAYGVLLQTA